MEDFSFSSPSSCSDIEKVGGGQKNKPTDQSPLWLPMTNSKWNISNLIWKCILKILHCDQEGFILSMQEWFTSEIQNDSLHSIKREVTEYELFKIQSVFDNLLFSCLAVSKAFVIPQTVACQTPLSMGFCRQEHWSWLPFTSPGDLPNPGIEPAGWLDGSPALRADSLLSEPQGSP